MTTNFPNCTDVNLTPFAWALRNDAETVAQEIVECVGEETKLQLAALLAMSDRIFKRYVEEDTWTETTKEECIEHTEHNRYWKPGTVLEMLKDGHSVHTPFAVYKMEAE